MGTTTTTPTPPRFNPRSQQQSIFGSRSQQGVPSQISAQTLTQLQQILARNNGEPQQNSFFPSSSNNSLFPSSSNDSFFPSSSNNSLFPSSSSKLIMLRAPYKIRSEHSRSF